MRWLVVVAVLAGCPKGGDTPKPIEPPPVDHRPGDRLLPVDDAAAAVILPPAPPQPAEPRGLPAIPLDSRYDGAIALGEVLFHDPRLSTDSKTSCATCHDPAHGYAGAAPATGEPKPRRAPPLVNLAWHTALGSDGRYASLDDQLAAHLADLIGADVATTIGRIGALPRYRALNARAQLLPADAPAPALVDHDVIKALHIFVTTRYEGDSPWDRVERAPDAPAELKAGYKLFAGKAQCAVCHTPPLYTDLAVHDGVKTPTVRGAAARAAFFHDGSATTLDAAIDAHPAIKKVALSPTERAQLGAFVRALTASTATPTKPVLP